MISVGIMTWFKYRNYGTALQAVALNKALRELGYDAVNIDYDFSEREISAQSTRVGISTRVYNKVKRMMGYRPYCSKERDGLFESFLATNLPRTHQSYSSGKLAELNARFDAFVCGSDQIWSPRCFDPNYYLEFVEEDHKKIAYAPSFGCENISDKEIERRIRQLLLSFSAISVREQSAVKIVEQLVGVEPKVVADPTLLLDGKQWDRLSNRTSIPDTPYCLMYFLGSDAGNIAAARKIANKRGLKTVLVPVYERQFKQSHTEGDGIGPAEFVALISSAELVCTDSFHGIVFSTIFERDFIAFERFSKKSGESQNTRIYSYLNYLGCESLLLKRQLTNRWSSFCNLSINYENVSKRIQKTVDESKEYLRLSLQKTAGDCIDV